MGCSVATTGLRPLRPWHSVPSTAMTRRVAHVHAVHAHLQPAGRLYGNADVHVVVLPDEVGEPARVHAWEVREGTIRAVSEDVVGQKQAAPDGSERQEREASMTGRLGCTHADSCTRKIFETGEAARPAPCAFGAARYQSHSSASHKAAFADVSARTHRSSNMSAASPLDLQARAPVPHTSFCKL